MRHEMSIATIEGAVEEFADEMAGPERAISPPIGAEATQEAGGDGAHRASLARRRKEVEEMETAVAKNEAEVRQLAAGMAVLGAELVGSDTVARAGELGLLIMAGARPASELVELFRSGYKRVQAARIVQAAVRCFLRRPLPAQDPSLQRLRHGAFRAWEVHAATGRCAMPLKLWLTSDPAARRYRFFLLGVPKARRTLLAIRMRRGVDAAIMASVGLARAHAARQI